MNNTVRIIIAESSVIIRSGLDHALKHIPQLAVDVIGVSTMDMLNDSINIHKPDIIIINPYFDNGKINIPQLKSSSDIKCIALQLNLTDNSTLSQYDGVISIYDDEPTIGNTVSSILNIDSETNAKEPLSQREKEIITGVVKGLTNKEIAEQLYISVHTVITHRRNIARKLEIHSPAGLTIYAIVNKLVDIKDIQMNR
ncbi:MAG: response regulator transcription factor [bacterium]|uniref:Response regulator transcription factor n=1 Tax=Candidatus Aphodosoma intestinipullorum TaxID=2840674 RepID=A0A940DJI6_9BACT|nr:response regulator transcription factor [Candidatus Aphodosoma intestinipullorum]